MIVVIIAGGSGTRLWPLSTPDFPKHLLKINGSDKSLLQHTYDRAKKLSENIFVVTDASHSSHVKEQLPDLAEDSFIIEPGRRGTASCIVAALVKVASTCESSEPIAVLSADHYIRDTAGFIHSFRVAEAASKSQSKVVLVGVEPDHPATGFGYIQKGKVFDEKTFVFNVHSFKEKPAYNVAKDYVKSGEYLWNCGYFVASVDSFVTAMKTRAPELYDNYSKLSNTTNAKEYEAAYLAFENNTIDYALIEKMDNLLVVPASFDWMDLGSFGDLHKAVGGDEQGNYIQGGSIEIADLENSFIQNDEDKPVAVIGLDNVVVVNTKDGLLVARKDLAQQVGEVSKKLNGAK